GTFSDYQQHRFKLASLIQRAKYFMVYKAKIDEPEVTAAQEEIGLRFFEGAAGGAVMIGQAPMGDEIGRQFDWPDAVIPLPFGSTDIMDLLAELDRAPDRRAAISRNNLIGTLRKHDWVYRWAAVLAHLGLEPTPAMLERKANLRRLAERIATV